MICRRSRTNAKNNTKNTRRVQNSCASVAVLSTTFCCPTVLWPWTSMGMMAYAGVSDVGRRRGGVHGRRAARAGWTAWARLQPGSEHLFEECGNVVVTPIEDRSDHLDAHPLGAAAGTLDLGHAGAIGLD